MNFNFTQLKSTARRAAAILLAALLCACLLGSNVATSALASASGDASGNAPVQCEHNWKLVKKAAGVCTDGYQYYKCTDCGQKKSYKTLTGYSANYLKNFSVSAGRKSFTAKWTKQSKANQAKYTGFQIRYSTSSTMNKAKTLSVGKSYASKTAKNLTAKKRYYVQGRTYTKKNGKTYYSSWSAKKSVVTKR